MIFVFFESRKFLSFFMHFDFFTITLHGAHCSYFLTTIITIAITITITFTITITISTISHYVSRTPSGIYASYIYTSTSIYTSSKFLFIYFVLSKGRTRRRLFSQLVVLVVAKDTPLTASSALLVLVCFLSTSTY